jgi:hypothetical protein
MVAPPHIIRTARRNVVGKKTRGRHVGSPIYVLHKLFILSGMGGGEGEQTTNWLFNSNIYEQRYLFNIISKARFFSYSKKLFLYRIERKAKKHTHPLSSLPKIVIGSIAIIIITVIIVFVDGRG